MTQKIVNDVQLGYDRIAEEYAHRLFEELRNKLWIDSCSTGLATAYATVALPATWVAGLGKLRVICKGAELKPVASICRRECCGGRGN